MMATDSVREQVYQCRYCLEECSSTKHLTSPCKCKGTQAFVHYDCLDRYRAISGGNSCPVCTSRFEGWPGTARTVMYIWWTVTVVMWLFQAFIRDRIFTISLLILYDYSYGELQKCETWHVLRSRSLSLSAVHAMANLSFHAVGVFTVEFLLTIALFEVLERVYPLPKSTLEEDQALIPVEVERIAPQAFDVNNATARRQDGPARINNFFKLLKRRKVRDVHVGTARPRAKQLLVKSFLRNVRRRISRISREIR